MYHLSCYRDAQEKEALILFLIFYYYWMHMSVLDKIKPRSGSNDSPMI